VTEPEAQPGGQRVPRLARDIAARYTALPVLRRDALLYLVSAVFAFVIFASNTGDYHTWGEIATVPYLIGAIVSEARYRYRPRVSEQAVRRIVLAAVFGGAVLAPLGCLIVWQAEALPGMHAQVEVGVIEAAGDRAVHGHDPYLSDPAAVGVNQTSDDKSVDANTYFTYLPAIVPFGMTNDLPGPLELGDARLTLLGFTTVVALLTIAGPAAVFRRRARVLQVLLVLPTGALPLVSGGDDLPVLALMLLSVVFAARRAPVKSGLAMGLAAAMKLTAWPLLVLLAFAQRDRTGRPAWRAYGATVLAVVVPIVLAGFAPDPSAFIVNVVKFPLGLAKVNSPAASPLLGEALTSLFPGSRKVITVLLLLVGVVIVLAVIRRYPPRTPATACRLTGFALTVAMVLSPATRFGYLIYPANLVVWASMIESSRTSGAEAPLDEFSPGPEPGRFPSPQLSPDRSGSRHRAPA
jgi:hypothetical protein